MDQDTEIFTNILKTLEDLKIKNVYVFDLSEINKYKKKKISIHSINLFTSGSFEIKFRILFLVTPTGTHNKIATQMILKNKDLFIEKPVTLSSKHIKN